MVGTCIEGVLHFGRCDFGDGDETAGGFGIAPFEAFLTWMIRDLFGANSDALREYIESWRVNASEWMALQDEHEHPDGLCRCSFADQVGAELSQIGWRGSRMCHILHPCGLALSLLTDRC